MKMWNEVPFPVLATATNQKLWQVERTLTKSAKDLCGHSNCNVDFNEYVQWMVASPCCKLTRIPEQYITVKLPNIFENFQWLTVDSAVVLYISWRLQLYNSILTQR